MKSISCCASFFKSLLIIISLNIGLLSSQVIIAQPANDLCSGAITVPVDVGSCTSGNTTGTNVGATDSQESPAPCGNTVYGGGDVWYEFTMPAGETNLVIDLISPIPGGILRGQLYEGSCGSLSSVLCASFLDPNGLAIYAGLTGGNTYFLRIFEGGNNAFGSFEFCLSTVPSPANDLCTGAIPVTVDIGSCTSGNTTGTNAGATDSQESPAPCGNTIYDGGDVWYEFTMPAGETNLVIDLISPIPGGNLRGQLYEGSCGSLSRVLCASFLDPNGVVIYAGLTGGNTYFLRIFEGRNDAFGSFEFCLRTLPPPACATNEAAAADPNCGTFDVVLSWDAVTDAAGYKITVGTSSGGVDVENNTDLLNVTSYTLVSPTVSTTYFWTVTPYNSAGDATACSEFSFTTAAMGCYCPSVPISNDVPFFINGNGFIDGTIGNTSYTSFGDLTYEDHTGGVVEQLTPGSLVNCMITFDNLSFPFNNAVWIDFNDDFVFDTSEQVFAGSGSGSQPVTSNLSFTVPVNAQSGIHRMRILVVESGVTPDPCFNGNIGLTLDFHVDIICPSSLTLTGTNTGDDSNADNIADNESSGLITSDQTIPANAVIDYDSATSIELLPGFNTILGAVLEAFIDGCNNGGGGSNAKQDDNTNASKK